jgi:hypothetical protein
MVMPKPRRGLWSELTVDAMHELARDDDRVGAVVVVAARQGAGRGQMPSASAASGPCKSLFVRLPERDGLQITAILRANSGWQAGQNWRAEHAALSDH